MRGTGDHGSTERPDAPMSKVRRAARRSSSASSWDCCRIPSTQIGRGRIARRLERLESTAGESVVAALTPGPCSSLRPARPPRMRRPRWMAVDDLAAYLWAPRTEIDLTVGPLTRSPTIDFFSTSSTTSTSAPRGTSGQLAGWTALLDLLYLKLGRTSRRMVSRPTRLRAAALRVRRNVSARHAPGRAHGADHPRGAGRGPTDVRRRRADHRRPVAFAEHDAIDSMFGGRIAYDITDRRALVPGRRGRLRIYRTSATCTYNLIAGLNWRFTPAASAFVGWRYTARRRRERLRPAHARRGRVVQWDVSLAINFYF